MKLRSLLPAALLLLCASVRAQNMSAIDAYLQLTDALKQNVMPAPAKWTAFFTAPAQYAYIAGGLLDSAKLKADMQLVYMPSNKPRLDTLHLDDQQQYHLQYKQEEPLIRASLAEMKRLGVRDSIKKMLFPYLPERLRKDSLLPVQYLFFAGFQDSRGLPGSAMNDMLLTARLNRIKYAVAMAHEALHSIILMDFTHRTQQKRGIQSNEFGLFQFLSNLSQEGIADLIDKQYWIMPGSPFLQDMQEMNQDETRFAPGCVRQLDTLLRQCWEKKTVDVTYEDLFSSGKYAAWGGHIPGRYMVQLIRKKGLLPRLIARADDPTALIEIYQQATGGKGFSKESILFLQELRKCYL